MSFIMPDFLACTRGSSVTLRSNLQPAAGLEFRPFRSQVTRASIIATSMPLHRLLAHTAHACFMIPYTHHVHNAVNMIIRVPRFTPRCSRCIHTVCNCGIHAIRPMVPATSPTDSIVRLVMWLFIYLMMRNLHSLRSGRDVMEVPPYISTCKISRKKFFPCTFSNTPNLACVSQSFTPCGLDQVVSQRPLWSQSVVVSRAAVSVSRRLLHATTPLAIPANKPPPPIAAMASCFDSDSDSEADD